MEALHPSERRCSATNRRGTQCGRRPIPGGTVCVMHGGGAPQVRQRAQERLAALVEPSIVRLGQLLRQKKMPGVALGAVKDVLDRSGLGAEKTTPPPAIVTFTLVLDRPEHIPAPIVVGQKLIPVNGNGHNGNGHGDV